LHRIHEQYRTPGQEINKGDELGIFQFGGSSIIVAFQEGKIVFDKDIVELSRGKIQVAVEVGMSLGRASSSCASRSESPEPSSTKVPPPPGGKSYATAGKEDKVD
jgi:hypothetical protein